MTKTRSHLEARVVERVLDGADELIEMVSQLVALDTTARNPGDAPRDEERLQRSLAERLKKIGAECELWEPEPTGKNNRFVPQDLDFRGRPQLVALQRGPGGGRSLLSERPHRRRPSRAQQRAGQAIRSGPRFVMVTSMGAAPAT